MTGVQTCALPISIDRGCTARRNLANLYAIYSITYRYVNDYYNDKDSYSEFEGYSYSELKDFCNSRYGGERLQNHGYNNRAIGEFRNKTETKEDLFVIKDGKYKIFPDYMYAEKVDISKTVNTIIEKFIELIKTKDEDTIGIIEAVSKEESLEKKREALKKQLAEDAEARMFEIISFAILKRYYAGKTVWYGEEKSSVKKYNLRLYKTGRTNANDGGIDFVLKPVGRFFQVTEVGRYDKYFLDIDKVMRYPITFVVKTEKENEEIQIEMLEELKKHYGTEISSLKSYREAIEEIITLGDLNEMIDKFSEDDITEIVKEIILYFNLEMNIDDSEDEKED